MDFERFISKDDQLEFRIDESEGEHFPCDLYDHQSENDYSHSQYTLDQILTIVTQKQGLIDRPINEIISEAIEEYHMSETNIPRFVREVKKNKNILKRNRAKNRNFISQKSVIFQKKEFAFDESSTEKDTVLLEKQIKKQRNRISAQISRDRKKNYVVNLEQKNRQLQLESENLRLQNEKLRKQILLKNTQNTENPKGKQQNKFMRLLIMLGFIFFVYIIKDMFNFKSGKTNADITMQNETGQCEQQMTAFVSIGEHNDVVQAIKREISDIESKQPIQIEQLKTQRISIKDTAIKKINQLLQHTKKLMIPAVLAHRLLKVRSNFNF